MVVGAVEIISATDRQLAVASLTLAFSSGPVMRWGWPASERYLSYWPRIADAFGGGAFDHGTAYGLGGCVAVALSPFVPGTAATILEELGQPADVSWSNVAAGKTVAVDGIEPAAPLFPRVDAPAAA